MATKIKTAAATKTTTAKTSTGLPTTSAVNAAGKSNASGIRPALVNGQLPPGFSYPFKRIAMEERLEDSMAVIATVAGQSLETVRNKAFALGFPKYGPAWLDRQAIADILSGYGLIASDWKETSSIAALPAVAMMTVDMVGDKSNGYGRFVLFTHFKGTDEYASFNAVCDPAHWIEPEQHISSDFKHLRITFPLWYLELSAKAMPKATGSAPSNGKKK